MIQATELRIGNWVRYIDASSRPSLVQIQNVGLVEYQEGINHFTYRSELTCILYSEIEGIPLTPELIEACGFEIGNKPFFYDTEHGIFLDDGTEFPHIKYLHQVQNLYHAMTGQELTVNIPQPVTT